MTCKRWLAKESEENKNEEYCFLNENYNRKWVKKSKWKGKLNVNGPPTKSKLVVDLAKQIVVT